MYSSEIGKLTETNSGLEIHSVYYCLEDLLESDDLFVDYLNAHLRLPVFPEPLLYNRLTGGLEVVADEERRRLLAEITAAFNATKSGSVNFPPTKTRVRSSKTKSLPNSDTDKNSPFLTAEYTVKTLDLEQGTEWLKERRLPMFLDGDLHLEYRLAKMLSQTEIAKWPKRVATVEISLKDSILDDKHASDSRFDTLIQMRNDATEKDDSDVKPKKSYTSSGQLTPTERNSFVSQSKLCLDTKGCNIVNARPHSSLRRLGHPTSQGHLTCTMKEKEGASELPFPLKRKNDQEIVSRTAEKSGTFYDEKGAQRDDDDVVVDYDDDKRDLSKRERKTIGLKRRVGILAFKKFLKGTSGEKVWNLWMDVERGKQMADKNDLKRHLLSMKERYAGAGAKYALAAESRVRLGLLGPANWNIDHLSKIQGRVLEPLLCYWGPRYLLQQENGVQLEATDLYKEYMKLKAIPEVEPYPVVLPTLPHRPKSCQVFKPRISIENQYNLSGKRGTDLLNFVSNNQLEVKTKKNLSPGVGRPRTVPYNKTRGSELRQIIPQIKETRPENVAENPHIYSSEKANCRILNEINSASESQMDAFEFNRLLEALSCEPDSGHLIRKNIDKCKNQLWRNCLGFWESCQEYHAMFYEEPFQPELLEKMAKYLYSMFIGPGAELDIACVKEHSEDIHQRLQPPFEELFDSAEEYAIRILHAAWESALKADLQAYNKIIKKIEKRSLPMNSAMMIYLQQKGMISCQKSHNSGGDSSAADPFASIMESLPIDLRDFTLQRILSNRLELEQFQGFLSDNYASLDLRCWIEIDNFDHIPDHRNTLRTSKANEIRENYLNRRYFFGPNSPADKTEQEMVIACGGGASNFRPTNECLAEVQKYVKRRLERKWVPLFLSSKASSNSGISSSVGLDHIVEDIIAQRKRRSGIIKKMLNSKWLPTTEKITHFRHALLNPLTSTQFMKFVSTRGNHLENNILFCQEVQKFKALCLSNSDQALIRQKGSIIVSCFLRSTIPPAVQITVRTEIAEQIAREFEGQTMISPYVFKDAQKRVFLDLLPHWEEFCAYRDRRSSDADSATDFLLQKKTDIKQIRKTKEKELNGKRKQETVRRRAPKTADPLRQRFGKNWLTSWSDEADDLDSDSIQGRPISWSHAKYLAAFKKERILARSDISEILGYATTSELTMRPLVSKENSDAENDKRHFVGAEHFSISSLQNADIGDGNDHRISNEVF